jgi:peptidoglycan/xylan/chitin deacetylase (PgdA/CDA1 family)
VNELIDGSEALRKAVLRLAGATGLVPLAKPFLGGVGAILMLHSVTARSDAAIDFNAHLTITPQFLDRLLTSMKEQGYEFVSMDEAVARLRMHAGGARFAAITLDDGYRDNMTEALPIFEKHETPFAVYVAPALIDGTVDLWWEIIADVVPQSRPDLSHDAEGARYPRQFQSAKKAASLKKLYEYLTIDVSEADQQRVVREIAETAGVNIEKLRRNRLLNWDEIRTLSAHPLATIGAHTVSHRNLARLDVADARREIRDAARIIASEIGVNPSHMAYPYGYASAVGCREVSLAKEAGYVSAVTTRHGVLRPEHKDHLLALPRLSVNGRYQRVAHMRTMLSGITTPLANRGRMVVTV